MDRRRVTREFFAAAGALAMVAGAGSSGCNNDDPDTLLTASSSTASSTTSSTTGGGGDGAGGGDTTATTTSGTGGSSSTTGTGGSEICPTTVLDDRILSYTEALRSASFKLVGTAPTLQQIRDLENAPDVAALYTAFIDQMMGDPRFAVRMVDFWRSALRMGGPGSGSPSRDTAPNFAARILVEGRPYTDLMTATTNTCPTFDPATGTFADGSCSNTITGTVGILTDPGVHSLYFGNMAFRRSRFFHETFLCKNALDPVAEPTASPGAGGPAGYASPWPWNSITGGAAATIDFLHDTGQICANCHATWNHRAPLWGVFDEAGMEQPSIVVPMPAVGLPIASRSDWIPDTESTAWKFGMPAANMAELGNQIANDPEVHDCAVGRMWNYAMSRGDIVETGVKVADGVIAPFVAELEGNNFNLKSTFRSILLSDDFVRF